jgi:hypothetical protein
MHSRHASNLTVLVSLAIVVALALGACTRPREGYQPEQPIPFSHYTHAGQNEIACQYCHVGPAMGRHSTVPSTNICMNCHLVVATDREPIKKLTEAYNNGTPIKWVKVHDLPDHAYFDHQPHVAFFQQNVEGNTAPGKMQGVCANCHGNVDEAAVVKTENEFNMGWCVNCHRENDAPIDCQTCHR